MTSVATKSRFLLAIAALLVFGSAVLVSQSQDQGKANPQEGDKPRFVDKGEYIEDTTTGLLWQKDGIASGKRNFYQAADYAKSITLGGLDGWRVPTAKELAAIFPATDKPFTNTKYNPNKCCAGGEFNSYWTSDLDKRLDDYAFIYQWYDKGGANNCFASKNFAYVRCVRGVPDASETAPLDDDKLAKAKELIGQLGVDDFAVRESATSQLKAMLPKIRPLLQEKLKETQDAEVKSRLRLLLGT